MEQFASCRLMFSIIKSEAPIYACKVAYFCDKCGKGVKLGIKIQEDGTKVRFCKKCQEIK